MHTYTSFSFITAILLATIFGVGPTTAQIRVQASPPRSVIMHNISAITGQQQGISTTNGLLNWRYTTGDAVLSSPAVANGIVYIGSNDSNIYALNATTGAKVWSFRTGSAVNSNPTVATGSSMWGVTITTSALDARTGVKVWSYKTGDNVFSFPHRRQRDRLCREQR